MFMKRFISCGRIKRLGRSDRPENEDNAQIFLSDVYKNSTQAKKYQAEASLYGRSMVEMLGVLAIIGVLSVGAIEGYNKAMEKHKLNKFSEAINTLLTYSIQNLKIFGETSTHTDVNGTAYYTDIFEKLNMLPEGIKRYSATDNMFLKDMFSNRIWIFAYPTGYGMGYSLKSEGLKEKLCMNLILIAKEHAGELIRFTTDVSASETNTGKVYFHAYGDQYCGTDAKKCLRHLTLDEMHEACRQFERNQNNRFYFIWR